MAKTILNRNAMKRFTRLEQIEMDKVDPEFRTEIRQLVNRPVPLERLRRKYNENMDQLDDDERPEAEARLRELNALQTEIGLSPEYNHTPDSVPSRDPQDDVANAYTFVRLSNNLLGTGSAQTKHATYGDYIRDPYFDNFNTV